MRKLLTTLFSVALVATGLFAPATAGVTSADIKIVADLNTMENAPEIYSGVEFNGHIYFSDYTARFGGELMRLNELHSEVVADVNTGSGSSWPSALTVFKDELYFVATNESGDRSLHKMTKSGIVTEIGVVNQKGYGQSEQMVVFNEKLFLFREDVQSLDSGLELWAHNGSTWTKQELPGGGVRAGMYGTAFAVVGQKLYFSLPDASNYYGSKLGVISSNGDIEQAPNSESLTSPTDMFAFGGKLLVRADGADSVDLYLYDGTNAPFSVNVADGSNGNSESYPGDFHLFNGKVYFTARSSAGNWSIFNVNSSGEYAEVALPAGFDSNSAYPRKVGAFGGRLYFAAENFEGDENENRAFSTNGTDVRLEPIFGNIESSYNVGTNVLNGCLFYNTNDDFGTHLNCYNGKTITTLTNEYPSNRGGSREDESKYSFAATSDALYFSASDGNWTSLYSYDETSAPTIVPGGERMRADTVKTIGNSVYIGGEKYVGYDDYNDSIWKYTGSGQLVEMAELWDAVSVDGYGQIDFFAFNNGLLVTRSDTAVFQKNDIIYTIPNEFTTYFPGVVVGSNYMFMSTGPDGFGVYAWNGLETPTKYTNFNADMWTVNESFSIDGRMFMVGDLGSGSGFYEIHSDHVSYIDDQGFEGDSDEIYSFGDQVIAKVWGFYGGEDTLWQLTTSGITEVESVNSEFYEIGSVSLVNGAVMVAGTKTINGAGSLLTLNENLEIVSEIETNQGIDEDSSGAVAYFKGQMYFNYLHPFYGSELATIGDVFSASEPGTPTGLTASTVTSSTVKLNWTAPSNNGGHKVSSYVVKWSTNGSTWTTYNSGMTAATEVLVQGLSPKTKYYFKVAASNLVGEGSSTASINKTTAIAKPTAPRSLKVVASKTTAVASWAAPAKPGSGKIINYIVETSLDNKKWKVVAHPVSKATKLTIKKLVSKKNYYVRVTAVSTDGKGVASAAVKFKTK